MCGVFTSLSLNILMSGAWLPFTLLMSMGWFYFLSLIYLYSETTGWKVAGPGLEVGLPRTLGLGGHAHGPSNAGMPGLSGSLWLSSAECSVCGSNLVMPREGGSTDGMDRQTAHSFFYHFRSLLYEGQQGGRNGHRVAPSPSSGESRLLSSSAFLVQKSWTHWSRCGWAHGGTQGPGGVTLEGSCLSGAWDQSSWEFPA